MRKVLVVAAIILLVFLAACSETQRAKPLKQSPTAAVTVAPQQEAAEPVQESTKTAAEALKDFKAEQLAAPVVSGPKSGSTGLPPAPAGVTGLDAMKARMKALYSQSQPAEGVSDVDTDFGSRFDDLPDDYGNDGSAGD